MMRGDLESNSSKPMQAVATTSHHPYPAPTAESDTPTSAVHEIAIDRLLTIDIDAESAGLNSLLSQCADRIDPSTIALSSTARRRIFHSENRGRLATSRGHRTLDPDFPLSITEVGST